MEFKKEELSIKDKIPKERRIRTKDTKGEFDEDGFFVTPNGSFWDMDGEYFNRFGFDIHGGKYIDKLDYIPGPTWIEELGCYPEDIDKYQKEDNIDDEMDMENGDNKDLKVIEKDEDLINKTKNLDVKNDKNKEDININKKCKNNKKNKKKKEESFDEEEWEEIDD